MVLQVKKEERVVLLYELQSWFRNARLGQGDKV